MQTKTSYESVKFQKYSPEGAKIINEANEEAER